MKKAYVWNDKEGDEEVIIASSKKEAREVGFLMLQVLNSLLSDT